MIASAITGTVESGHTRRAAVEALRYFIFGRFDQTSEPGAVATDTKMPLIVIVPARASWRTEFEALRGLIHGAAPAGSIVHHIGSTAIPGLAAKDVIDVQLTVVDLDGFDDTALTQVGFNQKFGLSDHCPPGLPLDSRELAKRFYNFRDRAANLHVREAGRFNQRYALLCRDFLRSHRVAAEAYALIKQRLVQRSPADADAYYEIKDPVFEIIMDGANEWALRTGWREPPPD